MRVGHYFIGGILAEGFSASVKCSSLVVESLIPQVVKTKGSFPSQEAAFKPLYLAMKNITKKWTMPIPNWKATLARFAIEHPDCFGIEVYTNSAGKYYRCYTNSRL